MVVAGAAVYAAVTAALLFTVIEHEVLLAEEHPVQAENLLLEPVAGEGALRITTVPLSTAIVKGVVPCTLALLPFSVYPIKTPFAGLDD
jgi:hypothetical protein